MCLYLLTLKIIFRQLNKLIYGNIADNIVTRLPINYMVSFFNTQHFLVNK